MAASPFAASIARFILKSFPLSLEMIVNISFPDASSPGPTQALQLGFELALKERDAALRENARAMEERDVVMRQFHELRQERDQALAAMDTRLTRSPKLSNK